MTLNYGNYDIFLTIMGNAGFISSTVYIYIYIYVTYFSGFLGLGLGFRVWGLGPNLPI